MARSVILGNGGLTVGLNESGFVHDFYFPYVGLENLTNARNNPHHIGVWVDGDFSWLSGDVWHKEINFRDDALIGDSTYTNDTLGLKLHFTDFVDANHDIFGRKVQVQNQRDDAREVRVFFHQVFQISAYGRSDTALYVPEGHYILDYKGRCSMLAYAETDEGVAFDQYAVGNTGIEGKEGTFRDAEDGELSNSDVEHASVDSTLRVSVTVEPNDTKTVHYWLAAADSQTKLQKLHALMLGEGFNTRLAATARHWQDWLAISEKAVNLLNPQYREMTRKSLLVIKAHIDKGGGIIASCDSSIYNYNRDYYSYVWPRDGAFALWPLIKLGYTKEPQKFFAFCADTLHEDGYVMHKYQPDKAVGSTWHPLKHGRHTELAIQEDETAITLLMLGEYLRKTKDEAYLQKMYPKLIVPMADFMARYIDAETRLPHASYDLWEQKFLTHTYTAALTRQALNTAAAAARQCDDQERAKAWQEVADMLQAESGQFVDEASGSYIKGFLLEDGILDTDRTLDVSSFYGSFMFGYGEKAPHDATLERIESELLDISPSGGTTRFIGDGYFQSDPPYQGNPWFVTTFWMAQYYALNGDKEKAESYVQWALESRTDSGMLSEQINPSDSSIVGVTPLVWSHAELINTIILL